MRTTILILIILITTVCDAQEYYSETETSSVTFEMYNPDLNKYGPAISRPSSVAFSFVDNWLYIHDRMDNTDRWYRIIDKVTMNGSTLITSEDISNNDELCGIEFKNENGHRIIEFVYENGCKFNLSAPIDLCFSENEQKEQ